MKGTATEDRLSLAPLAIWIVPLSVADRAVAVASSLLSHEERKRAYAFHSAVLQCEYLMAHAALRTVLSAYLRINARDIQFGRDVHGKPCLSGSDQTVHFNLSRTGGLALIAVSTAGPVGVDVEKVRRIGSRDKILAANLSVNEFESFQALPQWERDRAFLLSWTKFEAVLKARGAGVTSVETHQMTGIGWSMALHPAPIAFSSNVSIDGGYVGAIASLVASSAFETFRLDTERALLRSGAGPGRVTISAGGGRAGGYRKNTKGARRRSAATGPSA